MATSLYSSDLPKEYSIKAAFIEKFSKYIEWPYENNSGQFSIVIIGDNSLNNYFSSLKQRTIKNKPVHIKVIQSLSEMEKCDVLFVTRNYSDLLSQSINYSNDKAILTISEISGAAYKGVMINFFQNESSNINFEINFNTVKNRNFKMNPLLLEVGKIIR